MPALFAIRRFTLNTSSFTAITVPIDCSRIVVENADTTNDAYVRTDPNDADTQKTVPAGMELDIASPANTPFAAGTTICHMKASSGSGPAVVTYTR